MPTAHLDDIVEDAAPAAGIARLDDIVGHAQPEQDAGTRELARYGLTATPAGQPPKPTFTASDMISPEERERQSEFMREKNPGPEFLPVDPAAVMQAGKGMKNLVTGEGGRARAASDVIRGGLGVAASSPGMALAAPPALGLAAGIVGGGLAQQGVEAGLKKAGVPEGPAALGGDIAGLVGGGLTAGLAERVVRPSSVREAPPLSPEAAPPVSPVRPQLAKVSEIVGKVEPATEPITTESAPIAKTVSSVPPEAAMPSPQAQALPTEAPLPATEPAREALPPSPLTARAAPPPEIAESAVTLGSGLGALQPAVQQFVSQDLAPQVRDAGVGLVKAWDAIRKVAAPASRGPEAKTTALSMREHMADRQRAYDIASAAMEPAYKAFSKPSAQAASGDPVARQAVTDFIDRIERGASHPNPDMEQAAGVFRKLLDERRDAVQAVNPKALQNYIENYFPHIWKDPAKAKTVMQQILSEYMGKTPLEGNKSWQKMRTIPFFEEGVRRGLEPVSWNPVDLVTQRVVQMDKYIMAHRVFNDLKGQGLLKYVQAGERPPEGYAKIDDSIATVYGPKKGAVSLPEGAEISPDEVGVPGMRIMGQYYVPEPAARVINNHLSPGLRGNELTGPMFRAWTGASNWLNQLQLGFSLFHAGFTSVDAVTSKVALALVQASHGDIGKVAKSLAQAPGSWITQPFGIGDKLVKEWQSPGSQGTAISTLVEAMKAGGWRAHMDRIYKTAITDRMVEAWRSGNVIGATLRAPFAAVEQSVKPVLEWLVPRQKAGVVADLVRYEMERNPNMTHEQLREVAAKAVDSADNRMGQLAYDNLFWNKTLKDIAMLSVRSVGWNLGTFREIGGGALDARKLLSKNPELTYRASYIPALILTTGTIGAIMMYLRIGKGPTELEDYFFPKTGNLDEHGRPERISIPSYMKDVYHYSQEPGKTITNKLHPMLNLVAEMLSNRDYYGTEIRNADDPLVKQALQVAGHVGEAMLPFSVRGMQRERKLGGSVAQQVGNFVGFTPAPTLLNKTAAETLADRYGEAHREQGSRTQQQADRARARAEIVRAMRLKQDPTKLINEAKANGLITPADVPNMRHRAMKTPLELSVPRLTLREAMNVYQKATDEERKVIRPVVLKKVRNAVQKPYEWTPAIAARANQLLNLRLPIPRRSEPMIPAAIE